MRSPCSECPFLKASPLIGAPEWLEDIIKLHKENPFFEHSCHQTDPRADGFKGKDKKMECAGALRMMMNDIDGTPGTGGVYSSYAELIEAYLKNWLGEKKLNEMRAENRKRYPENW